SDNSGPATQLRYLIGKNKDVAKPIIYLPGVSRQAFRGIDGFPREAKHLYALQFQSAMWTQKNGKDWTPLAFMSSVDGGLGLDVAEDRDTKQAISDQLGHVLQAPVTQLGGHKLEAKDFHDLAVGDPTRTMLQWISSTGALKDDLEPEAWSAFNKIAKTDFGIDPDSDGVITAVGRLVAGGGKWNDVWNRYVEAPALYPGIRQQLNQVHPKDMFDENPRIPSINMKEEDQLRRDLIALSELPQAEANARLKKLCSHHIERSEGLWADLGEAPLARAVFHLKIMLDAMDDGIAGGDWEGLAQSYIDHGWKIDSGAWKAMECATDVNDAKAVSNALEAVYVPWLMKLADRTYMMRTDYPNQGPDNARTLPGESGTVILFVDGLRADLGIELKSSLAQSGLDVELDISWAALPTITATSKPAWNPLASSLNGSAIDEGMEPRKANGGGPLRTSDFRNLAEEAGWLWLNEDSTGDPGDTAWTETGNIDHYGHDIHQKLASRLAGELDSIESRVRTLFNAGWKKVVIVTDHGFLYVPGELPAVSLPKHLTISKWGRCALPSPDAHHNFSEVSWFWGGGHSVILAPGISVFRKGLEYSHGGLSLQECLTPVLTVSSGSQAKVAQISSISWVGLRCRIGTTGATEGFMADIRSVPMDESSTMSDGRHPLDIDGKASLPIVDDLNEGKSAYVVLIDANGTLVSQQITTVGEN
ncbi:MAG: BREX-1 system phosphatase PglZ type B, partial [Chloroflexi bacterium]|nr:BREX-1 system phosphatase PglZ type B [Chloroflexota bacterium]